MTSAAVLSAIKFNVSALGRVWRLEDLPWAFSTADVGSAEFVRVVAVFQSSHGLKEDGKLGPNTLATMRETMRETKPVSDSQKLTGPQSLEVVPPARLGVSNCIVVGGLKVTLPQNLLDSGVSASNWMDDGETRFKVYSRKGTKVTHLVIHESVTRDAATTVRVLKQQDFGVHLMVAPDGHVSCHNDLLLDNVVHGNQLNASSIGVEVVNPYTGKNLKAPYTSTIPATWWTWVPDGAPALYTLPTESQLRTLRVLVPWLCEILSDLPYAFPTKDLNEKNPRIEGYAKKAAPAAGVVAHRDYASHADGRYILEALING